MVVRRSVATCAFAVALCGALSANAQGPVASAPPPAAAAAFGGGPPPYTPLPGAKDLQSVLYNAAWHMGMLRGQAEPELIMTLEYQGEGTVQVGGQPCTLTKFRVSANYELPGSRTQIECTRANGQKYANIETVNAEYAWDEDVPGAEIVGGRGKATPRRGAEIGRAHV